MAKKAAGKISRIGGNISSYRVDARYGAQLPSKARINEIIRQAKKQGATGAAIVAEVDSFQGYEMTRGQHQVIRAFRGKTGRTPDALRSRLGASNQNTRAAIIAELRNATGAEQVSGLRNFQINFIYS